MVCDVNRKALCRMEGDGSGSTKEERKVQEKLVGQSEG